MTFNDYQQFCETTAVYPTERALEYLTLGLVGEAGEVANKAKKIFRDHAGKLTPDRARELVEEIGDVLWYVSELAGLLDWDLEQVAILNRDKLLRRKTANTIHGSGDNR